MLQLVKLLEDSSKKEEPFTGFHGSVYLSKEETADIAEELKKLNVKIQLGDKISALESAAIRFLLQSVNYKDMAE